MRLRSSQTRRSSREGLIANGRTVDQIREYLGVDSLVYLSLVGMLRCVTSGNGHYCDACFCGDYPIPIDPNFTKPPSNAANCASSTPSASRGRRCGSLADRHMHSVQVMDGEVRYFVDDELKATHGASYYLDAPGGGANAEIALVVSIAGRG